MPETKVMRLWGEKNSVANFTKQMQSTQVMNMEIYKLQPKTCIIDVGKKEFKLSFKKAEDVVHGEWYTYADDATKKFMTALCLQPLSKEQLKALAKFTSVHIKG